MANEELAAAHMNAVAAVAKTTAIQLEKGGLWPGEFTQAVALISDALRKAQSAIGEDR